MKILHFSYDNYLMRATALYCYRISTIGCNRYQALPRLYHGDICKNTIRDSPSSAAPVTTSMKWSKLRVLPTAVIYSH